MWDMEGGIQVAIFEKQISTDYSDVDGSQKSGKMPCLHFY